MKKIRVKKHNIELNREWLFLTEKSKKTGDASHERNFVISLDYLTKIFNEVFALKYPSLDAFLEVYIPEEEGEAIYQRALKDGEMQNEDICEVNEFLAIDEVFEMTILDLSDFNVTQSDTSNTWVRFSEIQEMIEQRALVVNPDKLTQYHKKTRI